MAKFPSFSSNIIYSGKSAAPTNAQRNNTDVVHRNVRLYIEGVQVPFTTIFVSQTYQQLPTATIEIPPASGLLDIIRGYQPKVHIFYEDTVYGGDRLLFWGHITSCNYSRRRVAGAGANITFNCVHKNALVSSFTLDYVDWAGGSIETSNDPNVNNLGGGVQVDQFNSMQSIIYALEGIIGVAKGEERVNAANSTTASGVAKLAINKADESLEQIVERLYGMPGIAINLWNQMKKAGYSDTKVRNLAMTNMWIPLTEEALAYFKRMSGHPLLEEKLQATKAPYCHTGTTQETDVLVPPTYRNPMNSAIQQEVAARAIQNSLSFAHELTTYPDLLRSIYETSHYDMITLSSPAEVPVNPLLKTDTPSDGETDLMAVETIIKPKMPFYFSPICNILFPKMYFDVQISQDDSSVPTRVTAHHDSLPGVQMIGVNFRGPHSVREATAYNVKLKSGSTTGQLSLSDTMSYSYAIPGKYEQGIGIRPVRISIPWWLTQVIGDKNASGTLGSEEVPDKSSSEYDDMMLLAKDWEIRYGQNVQMEDGSIVRRLDSAKANLNYYNPSVQVRPHERMMFASVDQEFAARFASSRVGSIGCLFNPYIIPGYPMDVIDDSPNHPSFHGFCTSVSHTITARSMSTSVSIASAMTYAEMSNYYLPPIPPFLQTALNLVNGAKKAGTADESAVGDTSNYSDVVSTLIQNPLGKATASDFYMQVLGVGAAAPDDLIHFTSGRAYVVERTQGNIMAKYAPGVTGGPELKGSTLSNGRGHIDAHTSMGNMKIIARPIETKESIESKFGLKFIDMDPDLYRGAQVNYLNPILASNFFLEPGASMFLDYMEVEDFIDVER